MYITNILTEDNLMYQRIKSHLSGYNGKIIRIVEKIDSELGLRYDVDFQLFTEPTEIKVQFNWDRRMI